jgi:hypothetical protein
LKSPEQDQNCVGRIEMEQPRVDLVESILICRACGADSGVAAADLVQRIIKLLPRHRKRRRSQAVRRPPVPNGCRSTHATT